MGSCAVERRSSVPGSDSEIGNILHRIAGPVRSPDIRDGWGENPMKHILDRGLFAKLHRTGALGAPVLINAGRGGLQNEADLLQCLDDGTLGAASLDVFASEPLPADSPFWTHPNIVLTPHNAADTDPDEISKYVARQIQTFEAGGALANVVDPARGY